MFTQKFLDFSQADWLKQYIVLSYSFNAETGAVLMFHQMIII